MRSIAIIGGGNMGEALIKGLARKKIFVCEANLDRARYLEKTYKVALADLDQAAAADVLIFAVKPQDMPAVLPKVGARDSRLHISIAAGLTTKFFEKNLGGKARVVRAMPNLPGQIGKGITAICKGKFASDADVDAAYNVLLCLGEVLVVSEGKMDAVTAVSGSGPAYLYVFMEEWINAAQSLGFSGEEASKLVSCTVAGSVELLGKTPINVRTLRERVTSKGGTTEAALKVFSKAEFQRIFLRALKAACKRAKELAK